jgi:hypothetical protein
VPDAGEGHREAVLVAGGDAVGVALRPAGLDDRRHARGGRRVHVVAEREERVGGQHARVDPHARLPHRDLHRIDPRHLPGPDAHDLGAGAVTGQARQDDRVTLHVLAHQPRELQGHGLALGRRPPGDHLPLGRVVDPHVAGLHE